MANPWPPLSCSQSDTAGAALQRVRATIAIAQGLASAGRTIDLTGLDASAGMLCARVLDLPPSEGSALRHELAELEARLSQLRQVLVSNHP